MTLPPANFSHRSQPSPALTDNVTVTVTWEVETSDFPMPVLRFPPFLLQASTTVSSRRVSVGFLWERQSSQQATIRCSSQCREPHPFNDPDDFSHTCGCEPAVHPDRYEQRILKEHAVSEVMHSSGCGGVGNITRSRSRSCGPGLALHSTGWGGAGTMLFSDGWSSDTLDQEERHLHPLLQVQVFLALCILFIFLIFGVDGNKVDNSSQSPAFLPGSHLLAIAPFFQKCFEFLNDGFRKTGQALFQFNMLRACGYFISKRWDTVIVVSGEAGRKAFFTNRGFDLTEGFKVLSGAIPVVKGVTSDLQIRRVALIHKRLSAAQRQEHSGGVSGMLNRGT
ncbi:hypothetical protein EDD15DRAFT_2196735 [Pisolithus albus]|nr:hypothetical protein EDD15DRAFT_2196735 [Pisolithus albus]